MHDLYESWARMFPEMLRYTDDKTQIRSRIPAYLRDAHSTPCAPEARPCTTETASRQLHVHKTKPIGKTSAWDGISVDKTAGVLESIDVEEDDMDLFVGL